MRVHLAATQLATALAEGLRRCGGAPPSADVRPRVVAFDGGLVDIGPVPVDVGSFPVDTGPFPSEIGSFPVDIGSVPVDVDSRLVDVGSIGTGVDDRTRIVDGVRSGEHGP